MAPDTHRYRLSSNKIAHGLVLDGSSFAETIKGSNLEHAGATDFQIIAGYEDGIDCVRGSNYTFHRGVIQASEATRTFITLKGGIKGFLLHDIVLKGKVRFPWDISLGDHTIYNKGELMKQYNQIISNVRHESGRPVRILTIDAEKAILYDGDYRQWKIPTIIVRAFMKLKN